MKYNLKTLISILTIISFLFPVSSGAKITRKPIEKGKRVKVITIKKGDTLWDLAEFYYRNPFMWKKFQEFNFFTNPDLIFPGEKLVISVEDAKKIKKILEERAIEVEEELGEEQVIIREVVKEVKIPVPVQDEALLKKIAGLEQKLAQLENEHEKLKREFLKKEGEMLRICILELEKKLGEEKSEIIKLKKEKVELEEITRFLLMGIMCGVVLLNTFK